MSNNVSKTIKKLKKASPLESARILQDMEMYDAKSSQEIIDEVYEQFENGENMEEEILKPVFMSIADGLLEATASGRAARKKGLTASRVLQDCKEFSYGEKPDNTTNVNGYTEYKNMKEFNNLNPNMHQEYSAENRKKLYEDKGAMERYKNNRVIGEKTLKDEYTGKENLYLKRNNVHKNYNDHTHRKQAQPDHVKPLKVVHEEYKNNYALSDADIKKIANIDENLAVTSAQINQVKKDRTNKGYIELMDANGQPLDKQTKQNMLQQQKKADSAVKSTANKIVAENLMKDSEVQKTTVDNAASQAKDYAIGNLILFLIKPIYYEFTDIFINGLEDGVYAQSGMEAIKIRFSRVTNHVLIYGKEFLGDNLWEFVKGFVSSLIEGMISLFVGMLKQILRIVKEGIKVFTKSSKILFGPNSKNMTAAEKGDAIIKLLGGSVIAISGIGIEALLNKIGIQEPWSIVLSTMLSGIASALFMYMLDKIDLFNVKAEKRHNKIMEIFDERIKDINDAVENCNVVMIELLAKQRKDFQSIQDGILKSFESGNVSEINEGLYKMAEFMHVKLEYSNTEEFCEYMNSEGAIYL